MTIFRLSLPNLKTQEGQQQQKLSGAIRPDSFLEFEYLFFQHSLIKNTIFFAGL